MIRGELIKKWERDDLIFGLKILLIFFIVVICLILVLLNEVQ